MFKRLLSRPSFFVSFRLFSGAALSVLTVLAPAARAADKNSPPPRDGRYMEHFIARLEKELDLTPGQAAQVREILRPDSLVPPPEHFAKEERHKQGPHGPGMMGLFGEEFLDQLRADRVDTAALNRAFAEHLATMESRHNMYVFKFVQLHGVLTPAQRYKLADILEKRRADTSGRPAGKRPAK